VGAGHKRIKQMPDTAYINRPAPASKRDRIADHHILRDRELFDLVQMLDEAADMLERPAKNNRVRVTLHIGDAIALFAAIEKAAAVLNQLRLGLR
jgi:hypothetical protein